VDLYPTDDQFEIINSAADYLGRELPADRMPKQEGTAPSPLQWRGLAEMGWFGLGLAEEAGGLGLSVVEEALVMREFGRCLAPPSAMATVLAAHLAAGAGDAALVEALTSGRRRAGFALPAGDDPTAENGAFTLLDSNGADLFVVWTPTSGLLAPREAFADLQPIRSIDDALEALASSGLDASRVIARDESPVFQHRARLLACAMLTGGAEAIRDLSAEYAKVRQQFGKAIGSYQAISHKCAVMAVDCEASMAVLYYAAVCVRDGSPEAELYTAAAKLTAGSAARNAAAASMQIHGGYGQTYEYLPHFYLKRAHIYQALGGGERAVGVPVLAARSTL
jgi:alkylation response protein AidB-like acyl-CoA dehydrogenase